MNLQPSAPIRATDGAPRIDWARIRGDFPLLQRQVHGKPLVYLDSANTGQKPEPVIAAADFPLIRHFKVSNVVAEKPADDVAGGWVTWASESKPLGVGEVTDKKEQGQGESTCHRRAEVSVQARAAAAGRRREAHETRAG